MTFIEYAHNPYTMSLLANDLFIEMREISEDIEYDNKTMYQLYQGQLNISIVQDLRQLSVNIESARHLPQSLRKVYVRVKLTHANHQRTIHRTHAIQDDHPVWNYSCNIKLKSKQYSTLLLSAWSVDSQCLGCMTFNLQQQNTCTTVAEGWHFLLHKSLGTTHHLKVTSHRPGFDSHRDNTSNNTIRASYSTYHTVHLKSSFDEYGMKLSGQHPVRICKVIHGSIAAKAGILVDDSLIRINDLDVSSLDISSVVQLILQSGCSLQITIARNPLLDVLPLQRSPRKLHVSSTATINILNLCYVNDDDVCSSNSDLLMYNHCRN